MAFILGVLRATSFSFFLPGVLCDLVDALVVAPPCFGALLFSPFRSLRFVFALAQVWVVVAVSFYFF